MAVEGGVSVILVLNAGSSSVKFALYDAAASHESASGLIDWKGGGKATQTLNRAGTGTIQNTVDVPGYREAVQAILHLLAADVKHVAAIGHRVVHGGTRYQTSVRIDEAVKTEIDRLSELAPLHNPPALQVIHGAEHALANVPQVAVFDTAFFATLPEHAHIYPLPYEWYQNWGIRRFGFHGISHAYCTDRAAELLGGNKRLVICHLGNGCSASAVRDGKPIASSMGFTPLEGLMMGTRCGWIDASIPLFLQKSHGLSVEDLDDNLQHASGLLGVSGVSSDYRSVEEAANQGNGRAGLAMTMFADRVRSVIGAYAVTLGGLDALLFTAGIGEHSASLRASVCAGLECVGLRLDGTHNRECRADADCAAADSLGRILVLATREELMIARETRRVLGNS
jgi:acetate kinase